MRWLVALAAIAAAGCQQAPADGGGVGGPGGRVVDRAGLLAPQTETRLVARLAMLEQATSDQLVVMTLPSLDGRPIEEVALRIARREGYGQKGKDNGALLLVAPNEQKVRLETGRGLAGVVTDGEAGAILRTMAASFKRGAMEDGIVDGVARIEHELREDPTRPALLRKDEPWPA